jgi:hypothetical protein
MEAAALRKVLVDKMLQQIDDETYPSVTMMNRVEATLESQDQVEEYVKILIAKSTETQYPSISMLNRIDALLDRLE